MAPSDYDPVIDKLPGIDYLKHQEVHYPPVYHRSKM
jgi:hypothetical protein